METRKFINLGFFSVFCFLVFSWQVAIGLERVKQSKKGTISLEYGICFGNKSTPAGEIFKFKNFNLVFGGYRELTSEQKSRKEKSIAEGYDGGESMLQPSNAFSIFQGSKKILEFELMILPYATYLFDLDGKKFEVSNDSEKNLWVVNVLK